MTRLHFRQQRQQNNLWLLLGSSYSPPVLSWSDAHDWRRHDIQRMLWHAHTCTYCDQLPLFPSWNGVKNHLSHTRMTVITFQLPFVYWQVYLSHPLDICEEESDCIYWGVAKNKSCKDDSHQETVVVSCSILMIFSNLKTFVCICLMSNLHNIMPPFHVGIILNNLGVLQHARVVDWHLITFCTCRSDHTFRISKILPYAKSLSTQDSICPDEDWKCVPWLVSDYNREPQVECLSNWFISQMPHKLATHAAIYCKKRNISDLSSSRVKDRCTLLNITLKYHTSKTPLEYTLTSLCWPGSMRHVKCIYAHRLSQ